jgi:hypothetical protein
MSEKISRRTLAKSGLAGLATLAIAPLASAQIPGEPGERELSKPLTEEAKKLLEGQRKNYEAFHKDRLKTKLEDCSEPCTTYVPTAVKK